MSRTVLDSFNVEKHSKKAPYYFFLPCLLSSILVSSCVGFIFLPPLSNAVKLIWWLPKLILLLRSQSVAFLIKLWHSWSGVFKAEPGISGSLWVDPESAEIFKFLLSQVSDLSTRSALLHFFHLRGPDVWAGYYYYYFKWNFALTGLVCSASHLAKQAGFFSPSDQKFSMQTRQSICGPLSAAVAINALGSVQSPDSFAGSGTD